MTRIQLDDSDSPYAALPVPLDRYRLTPLRYSDAEAIHDILKREEVASQLSSVPFPYTLQHAHDFLHIVKGACIELASSTDWRNDDEATRALSTDWLLCAIRDPDGSLVGDISIRRNGFEGLESQDPQRRKRLLAENEAKSVGDPTLSYSVGYYLDPAHQRKGIMTAALSTAIDLARKHLGLRELEGICRADNAASRRVLEKAGLKLEEEASMPWKGGSQKIYILRRSYPD